MNIYIESSVKGLKRQNGIVGFVIEKNIETGDTVTQFGKVTDATENLAELLALKYALKRVPQDADITVYTDNKYIAGVFGQNWLSKWMESGWKTAKNTDVANKEHWQAVTESLGSRIPDFRLAEPHSYKRWLQDEVKKRAKAL